jgi:hypothetical protein
VLWSDETWVSPGRHTRAWVTRRIGEEEVYHADCVEERHQRKIGWMFWGSISGRYGRYKGLFWEKDWETVNEGSYSELLSHLFRRSYRNIQSSLSNKITQKGTLQSTQSQYLRLLGLYQSFGLQTLLT